MPFPTKTGRAVPCFRDELKLGKTMKANLKRHAAFIQKFQAVLEADGSLTPEAAREAAFHLTDWIEDLVDFADLLRRPGVWPKEEARSFLMRFLVHVPNHLNAAHRILHGRPVLDAFELGAVKGSGRAKRRPGGRYTWEKRVAMKEAAT